MALFSYKIQKKPELSTSRFIETLMLEYAISLLSDRNQSLYISAHSYLEFINNVQLNNINPSLTKYIHQLLQELFLRSLAEETLQLFYLAPPPLLCQNAENIHVFVWAYKECLKEDKSHLNKLELVLDAVPEGIIIDKQLRLEMSNFCILLFDNSIANKAFLHAQKWLKRGILYSQFVDSPPNSVSKAIPTKGPVDSLLAERAFQLFAILIAEGHLHEACALLDPLETPIGFESEWLKACQVLLSQQQIAISLNLIKKKNLLISMHEGWTAFLKELLAQAREFEKSYNKMTFSHLELLLQSIHALTWKIMPNDSGLWMDYFIALATCNAPIKIVEEAFERMVKQDFKETHLQKTQKIICLELLLKRLSEEGSGIILNVNLWWEKVWEEFELAKASKKEMLINCLANGSAKAIEKQRPSKALKDKVKRIVGLLTSTMQNSFRETKNPESLLSFAKICLFINELPYLHLALDSILLTFIAEDDPIVEAEAVKVANQCTKLMVNYLDEPSIMRVSSILQVIQQSDHSDDADHFRILDYFDKIDFYAMTSQEMKSRTTETMAYRNATNALKTMAYRNATNALISIMERDTDITNYYFSFDNSYHLYPKLNAMRKIIENPWQRTHETTQKEKALFCKVFNHIRQLNNYDGYKFLEWCIEQPNYKLYVTDQSIRSKVVKTLKAVPKISFISSGSLTIIRNIQILQRGFERSQIMHDCNLKHRFHWMAEELRAQRDLKSCCWSVILKGIMIAGFTTAIFTYMSAGMDHK